MSRRSFQHILFGEKFHDTMEWRTQVTYALPRSQGLSFSGGKKKQSPERRLTDALSMMLARKRNWEHSLKIQMSAVRAEVKIELSYLNDIMVIAFFFLATTNKDNAKVALATSNS